MTNPTVMNSVLTINVERDINEHSSYLNGNKGFSGRGKSAPEAIGDVLLTHAQVRLTGRAVKQATTEELGRILISDCVGDEQEGVVNIQCVKQPDAFYAYLNGNTGFSGRGRSEAEAIGELLWYHAVLCREGEEACPATTAELSTIQIKAGKNCGY